MNASSNTRPTTVPGIIIEENREDNKARK